MPDENGGSVRISTNLDGTFQDVVLREGALGAALEAGAVPWTRPVLLYGADVDAEIDALVRAARQPWLPIRGFRDLAGKRRGEFSEMEGRLDPRFYEHVAGGAKARLNSLLRGQAPFDELVEFVALGPSGQGYLSRTGIGRDFADHIELLCNTTGLILPWQMKNSFMPALVLAIWVRRSRLHPLILHFPKRFGVPSGEGQEVAAGGIRFDALAEEAERVLGMTRGDVEKAYRVWQLSRVGDTTKPQATTPQTISREIAHEFLGVAARARTDRPVGVIAPQKPAPLIFELESGVVDLRQGAAAQDKPAVIKAGAASLRRRIERLGQDAYLSNVVPSAKETFEVVDEILLRFLTGRYSDAEVIELGLEMNALQFAIDPVHWHLGEVSLGELAGLFANVNLFLSRFPAWADYTGAGPLEGRPEDGVAAFDVARRLLESARGRADFLTPEANERISAVLDRTSADDAPALREGVVRSGENLAAVTAEGLGHVVVEEFKAIGKQTKEEAYKAASTSVVQFAVKNASLLLQLGRMRGWKWLHWLSNHLPI